MQKFSTKYSKAEFSIKTKRSSVIYLKYKNTVQHKQINAITNTKKKEG